VPSPVEAEFSAKGKELLNEIEAEISVFIS
jgi:hypothetical protein